MLGPAKPRRLDQPIAVSLEDLVPAGPLLPPPGGQARPRASSATGRGSCYAERGRPCIDPVVFFKLQLVMFFEGIRSERQLIETASLNLAHRWYLGYALDEALPDHSSLTRIRQRLGHRHLPALLRAGRRSLSGGGPGLGPGALLRRHQGRGQRRPRLARPALLLRGHDPRRRPVRRRCSTARPRLSRQRGGRPARPGSSGCRAEPTPRRSPMDDPPWRLLEERRLDPHRPVASAATSARATSASAPPIPMPRRCAPGRGPASATTTTTSSTAARRASSSPPWSPRPTSWRTCRCATCSGGSASAGSSGPHQVTGDTTYGTVENIVALEDAGIRAYVPLPDFDAPHAVLRAGRRSPTTPSATSTAARRASRCRAATTKHTEEVVVYRGRRRHLQRLPGQGRMHRPATTAASSSAPSTPTTWSRCAATTPPRPTRRRCASGRSGSSRCLPKPRTGTACAGSGCAARERQHRGAADRGGQNLKRFLAATRLGAAPCPCGSLVALPDHAGGSRPSPGDDRSGWRSGQDERHRESPVTATSATEGFFQRPAPLPEGRKRNDGPSPGCLRQLGSEPAQPTRLRNLRL